MRYSSWNSIRTRQPAVPKDVVAVPCETNIALDWTDNYQPNFRTCKVENSCELANAAFATRHDATKRGNTPGNGSEWHAER